MAARNGAVNGGPACEPCKSLAACGPKMGPKGWRRGTGRSGEWLSHSW